MLRHIYVSLFCTCILNCILQANIRAKKIKDFKGILEKPPEEITEGNFFDPRVEYVHICIDQG